MTQKNKLYEVTVSFCVYADNEDEAWVKANIDTEELQKELASRAGNEQDMAFLHIDEPKEVIV